MTTARAHRRQVLLGACAAIAGGALFGADVNAKAGGRTDWRRTPAAAAGTLRVGGDLILNRIGFGTGRLNGPEMWGMPVDARGARVLLRRAVELGCMLIDTAETSGPNGTERLLYDALWPYPKGLVIATKGGVSRGEGSKWVPDGRPEHLREQCEESLRRLRLERMELYQLHVPDPKVPIEESVGELGKLQAEGKIRHIGLSDVDAEQLSRALKTTRIASVERRYNFWDRGADDVLAICERQKLAFLPWGTFTPVGPPPASPGSTRKPTSSVVVPEKPDSDAVLDARNRALSEVAARHAATTNQVALAWLLARSPVILPIPGTTELTHLEENVAAARIRLTAEDRAKLA
jgi:aryl-alcohol dehydrogenase-like predicted oxidoreductase